MTERSIRVGSTVAFFAFVLLAFLLIQGVAAGVGFTLVTGKITFNVPALWLLAIVSWASQLALVVASGVVLALSKRVATGTRGLTRLRIAAMVAIAHALLALAATIPIQGYSFATITLATLAPSQFMFHLPPGMPDWVAFGAMAEVLVAGLALFGLVVSRLGSGS